MKLVNKSNDVLKRPEQGAYSIKPGDVITVPDAMGEYLLTAESHYWSVADEQPADGKVKKNGKE